MYRVLVSWDLEGVVCVMASQPSAEEMLSLRHGFRCVFEDRVKVVAVLLAVGEQVEAEFIHSGSRMNKALVVFMKRVNLVGRLIASGIFVRNVLVPMFPLSSPLTRVVVVNLPPFITDDQIRKELSRFGKFVLVLMYCWQVFRQLPLSMLFCSGGKCSCF
jgi:hypothetical protein